MKYQKNFFAFLWKFILIAAAAIFLLLCVSCVLFSFYYKEIVRHFFDRELSVGKLEFALSTHAFTFHDISWGIPDGETLFSVSEVTFRPDLRKLLLLQLVVKQVSIDGIKTYLLQDGASYSLPPFLPKKKDSSFRFPSIPITVYGISLTNATVNLRKNGKDYRFLTELAVKLPALGSAASEIQPEISGNLNRKPFRFTGVTKFEENGDIVNRFKISSRRLDFAANRVFLPVFPGINMERGVADLDALVEYTIKRKAHSLVFSGTLAVENLALRTNAGKITDRLTGRATVKCYDFTNKKLEVQSLSISGGKLSLPKEMFAGKKTKNSRNFQVYVEDAKIKRLALELPGIKFSGVTGTIGHFSPSFKDTSFSLSAGLGKAELTAEGTSQSLSDIELNRLSVSGLDLFADLPAWKKPDVLKALRIDQLSGAGSWRKKQVTFSGKGKFSGVKYQKEEQICGVNLVSFEVDTLKSAERSVILQALHLSGAYVDFPQFCLSNGELLLGNGEHQLRLSEEIRLNDTWNIKTACAKLGREKTLTTEIHDCELDLKVQGNSTQLTAEAAMQLSDARVFRDAALFARLKDADICGAKFSKTATTARLNIDKPASAKFLYLKAGLNKTGKLELAGLPVFTSGAEKKKKTENQLQIHLNRLDIRDGEIRFVDERQASIPFAYTFSGISLKTENFPSFIYPKGNLELSGRVDGANPFSLCLTTGGMETSGEFTCSNALLPPFSVYAEKYLGHSIRDGRLSVQVPFSISSKEISSDVKLQLINPDLRRISASSFPLNLDKTLRMMMGRDGMVNLAFPVTVFPEKKKVQYIDLFFEVLAHTLQSSSERLSDPVQEKIIYDDIFSIAYFKGGSAELSGSNFLSEQMLRKIDSRKTVFTVNGYVDRQNDTEYLKRGLVAEALKKYLSSDGESARKIAMQQLLVQEYKEDAAELTDDTDVLLRRILDHLEVTEEEFRVLAFARANAVADCLVENYGVQRSRIYLKEESIFDNPYISGISNSITVVRSGRLVE